MYEVMSYDTQTERFAIINSLILKSARGPESGYPMLQVCIRCQFSMSMQACSKCANLGLGFWNTLAQTAELHSAGGGSQFGYALRRALKASATRLCLLFAPGLAVGSDTRIRTRFDIDAGTRPQARIHARVWLPLPQRRMRVLIHRRIDGRTVR